MRRKSEERRRAIVVAAYQLFSMNGFEKTSMAEINAKVGGSKATLYSYFSSKEELFVECMFDLAEHYLENAFASLRDNRLDVETALLRFRENAIRLICSPELLAAKRLMVAEAARSGIGRICCEKIGARQEVVTAFIARAMEEGALVRDDPLLASTQLRALLEAEVLEPCMLCARELPLDETTIRRAAARAVKTFMCAFGVA